MKIKDKPKEKLIEVTAPKKSSDKSEEVGGQDLSVLNSWYEASYQASRKERWQWFVIDQFLRGNHTVRGNSQDNSIEIVRKSNSINFPINKVYAVFRAVRGYVTRHKPVVEVEPEVSDESAKTYARRSNAILERDNQLNNFRKINKEWVYYGIKYGISYRQVGWDAENHTAIRWTVDPFNLLKGDKYGEIEDAPYLIKTVRRTVGYVRNKFPKTGKDIEPDNKLDDDEFKTLSLSITYNNQGTPQTQDIESQTVILYECWYKVFEKNSKGGTVNKVIFTKNLKLHFEETPYDEYPFISYKSDIVPNEANAEGAIKHIIAPQRMLNLLNTQLLEYNHLVNRGRFLKDKNAGFRVINAVEGQIIEKKAGSRVDSLPVPALNPALLRQIDYANDYIDEIGGSHDASRGAVPQRVSSGAAIEAIQTGDANNIADYRDNFEDALALEAAWILKMYSLYESEGVVATNKVGENEEKFIAIGSEANKKMGLKEKQKKFSEDNGDYLEVLNILPDNQVKVSVYSSLGETREERLNLMTKLVELGVPLKFLLEYLEFPNTTDIFDRMAQEALGDMAMTAMQTSATTPDQITGLPTPNAQTPVEATAPMPNPKITAMLANLKQRAATLKK